MAVPKVKLRNRKSCKTTSYFIDFTVDGKRYRLNAGINKRTAEVFRDAKLIELARGYLNIPSRGSNFISLNDLINSFLTYKRNHIRPSSLKWYKNYLDKFKEIMNELFPDPSLNVRDIKNNYIEEIFNHLLENEITNGKKWEPKTVNG